MLEYQGDFVEICCVIMGMIFLFLLYYCKNIFKPRDASEPPGPWCWPIIGYYYNFINKPVNILFSDLAQHYGNIYQLRLGTRRIVVVNGFEANKEIHCNKLKDFGNRPPLHCMQYLKRQGGILFDDYCNQYKETKELTIAALNGAIYSGEKFYEETLAEIVEYFLFQVKKRGPKSQNIGNDVLEAVSSIHIANLFGRLTKFDLEDMELIKHCSSFLMQYLFKIHFSDFSTNNFINSDKADNEWKRSLQEVKHFVENELVKHRQYPCQNSHPDVTDHLLRTYLSDHRIRGILSELFVTGICKFNAAMLWWIKLMGSHPDVLLCAQSEIDRIRPDDEMIQQSDLPKMPYVEACILEMQRYCTMLPLGLLQYSNKDKYLRGYLIPKNSIVMCNLWSVNRDKSIWKNPSDFNPSRFILSDCNELNKPLAEKLYSFGDGVRRCAGELSTKLVMFTLGANLIKNFNIKLTEENKFDVRPNAGSLLSFPNSFNAIFELRK